MDKVRKIQLALTQEEEAHPNPTFLSSLPRAVRRRIEQSQKKGAQRFVKTAEKVFGPHFQWEMALPTPREKALQSVSLTCPTCVLKRHLIQMMEDLLAELQRQHPNANRYKLGGTLDLEFNGLYFTFAIFPIVENVPNNNPISPPLPLPPPPPPPPSVV